MKENVANTSLWRSLTVSVPVLCILCLNGGCTGKISPAGKPVSSSSEAASPLRNLIPDQPSGAPNYFCTWAAQNFAQEKETSPRDHLTEELVFSQPGWISNYYQAIRGDLLVVFDDGWDVPLSADGSQERWVFGSLELNEKRFPSLSGNPAERLRKLNDKVRAAGWRGAGLWVSAQAVGDGHNGNFLNDTDLERYWRERVRWSHQAGIRYWKVDWGGRDDRESFRRLLTRIAREEAPELTIEHAAIIMPLNNWNGDGRFGSWQRESGLARSFAPFSDVFRTYDVCAQIGTVTLLDRTGWILKHISTEPGCQGLVNCEDEMFMGAALGCTVGIMRHPLWRMSDPRNNDFPKYGHRIDEVTRTVRWMRLAPPFGRGGESVYLSEQTLTDEWDFTEGQTWYRDVIGKRVIQRASAITARGIDPPEVVDAGDGVPFVVASRNPNGAVAVAALQRTLPGGIIRTPRAQVKLKVGSIKHPIGIFGPYHTLTLEFDEPIAKLRILAQDLAGDRAVEITNEVKREGRTLTLSGELIDRVGLSAKTHDDLSEPGLVLNFE
jgi:hypothetical protein